MMTLIERLRSKSPYLHGSSAERAMDEAADEIARLRAHVEALLLVATSHEPEALRLQAEIERLRATLQALHDWYVEYARINNLFNGDGTPATFHELLQARAALEPKQ